MSSGPARKDFDLPLDIGARCRKELAITFFGRRHNDMTEEYPLQAEDILVNARKFRA
jgi:hypothetical protein